MKQTDTRKQVVTTRIDGGLLERLKTVAQVDRRDVSDIVRMCIEDYLEVLEQEVAAKLERRGAHESDAVREPLSKVRHRKAS